MSNTDATGTERVIVFVLLVLLMPVSLMWHGYALSTLWGWFVVDALDAPVLSFADAIGLAVVVAFLRFQGGRTKDTRTPAEILAAAVVHAAFVPAWFMLVGLAVRAVAS